MQFRKCFGCMVCSFCKKVTFLALNGRSNWTNFAKITWFSSPVFGLYSFCCITDVLVLYNAHLGVFWGGPQCHCCLHLVTGRQLDIRDLSSRGTLQHTVQDHGLPGVVPLLVHGPGRPLLVRSPTLEVQNFQPTGLLAGCVYTLQYLSGCLYRRGSIRGHFSSATYSAVVECNDVGNTV